MNKKNALPLALLLTAFTLTTPPAADAHDHSAHAPKGQQQRRAQTRARRRTAKRRPNAQKQDAQKQQAMYSCPMHEEVRSKTPGKCPKCKMELMLEETPAKTESE